MAELLREVINPQTIDELGQRITAGYPQFDETSFRQAINPYLGDLALSERLDLVTRKLEIYLPTDFEQAAAILVNSLGEELDAVSDDPVATDLGSSRGFIVVAMGNFIARNGQQHFDVSMQALYEMTKRFSSEGPIREFLINEEEKTLTLFHHWAEDPNVHVRRLVSESTRPRLPWTRQLPQFIADPRPILPLLEKLKDDPHLYVRRSVANNLNDIAKDHPSLVVETLAEWQDDASLYMPWLTKHALRTLIKEGNSGALALLGFQPNPVITVDAFILDKKTVSLGEGLNFQLDLSSPTSTPQKLMIDYIIYHMKANGKLRPKVFKWTQKQVVSGKPLSLVKQHLFKKIRTRKYYAGQHEIHIQINGQIIARDNFILETDN
jgi:3-methyladenine DNA glycosylase AlkC